MLYQRCVVRRCVVFKDDGHPFDCTRQNTSITHRAGCRSCPPIAFRGTNASGAVLRELVLPVEVAIFDATRQRESKVQEPGSISVSAGLAYLCKRPYQSLCENQGTSSDVKTMLRNGLCCLLLICLGSVLSAQALPVMKVPDGTALRLALTQELSSATNAVDDPVHFDVTVPGGIAFVRGSTAVGHVVEVEPRRRMGRAGKLNFTVDHVKAPDGSNLRLRASSTRKGEDKTGTVIIGSVVLSPLFLIMRGKDITIPKGTEITAYIDGDREFALTGPPTKPSAVLEPSLAQSGSVTFRSEPDGADINIDGKFVGTTPSSLQLVAGDHVIAIEKAHFSPWRKTLTVAAGSSANVSTTLDKAQ